MTIKQIKKSKNNNNIKTDFFKYQAQTTPHPLAMEISHAEGSYIYDTNNKKYLDFVAGVSACPLGHRHPKVISAIKKQADKYLHVMVYGEYIQKPAIELTKLIAKHLPESLESTYLINSGTEAIEGALKLARRFTGRSEIIAAHKAYHGNTMGALSLMGFEERKQPFRPLVPDVRFITFNNLQELEKITNALENNPSVDTVQLTIGGNDFLNNWKKSMTMMEVDALKAGIVDDIQTIVDAILEVDLNIEIIMSFYDYPNFEETLGGLVGLVCSPLHSGMGSPSPTEINNLALEFTNAFVGISDQNPKVFHVPHWGRMQNAFGWPDDGIQPGDIQLPGDVSLTSPVEAMRDHDFVIWTENRTARERVI